MSATPRKLKLNIQTVRQLTNLEAAKAVGGLAPGGAPFQDGTGTCGMCTCQCWTETCRGGTCDPQTMV